MYGGSRKTPKHHLAVALTIIFVIFIRDFAYIPRYFAAHKQSIDEKINSGPDSIVVAATEHVFDKQNIAARIESNSGSESITAIDDRISDRVEPDSSAKSIVAIITTAEMGTEDLIQMITQSYECDVAEIMKMKDVQCNDSHRIYRTHTFDVGVAEVQEHRRRYPDGQCLIATGLRSPVSWFAAAYLQTIPKNDWKPKEKTRDFKDFLAVGIFNRLHKVLPGLLTEFNIGSLIEQAEIMDMNNGYSLIPAPPSSIFTGCNLLFLRMEQSDQWPDFFQMSDPNYIQSSPLRRELQQHPDIANVNDAIGAYELTSDEKVKIYNDGDMFTKDWFSAYKYVNVLPEAYFQNKYVLPASYQKRHYCAIDFSDDNRECFNKMSPKLKSTKFWHFFGDSQMGKLFTHINSRYPHKGVLLRGGTNGQRSTNRCAVVDYCQMERSAEWTPPDVSLSQGPAEFGLQNPWCSDLAGFQPRMWGSDERNIELFPVEYAQDVEQQTPDTSTTQETVTLCIKQRTIPRDDNVCVVNTGIHDQKVCVQGSTCHYMENIRLYLDMLDSVCGHIVWVGISSVKSEGNNPQRNDVGVEWNQQVYSLLASSYPDTSFAVDVWTESLTHDRHGNIHFEQPYYGKFASLFVSLM